MRRAFQLAALTGAFATVFWPQVPGRKPFEPKAPPVQPVPFSHKTHTAAAVKCLDCHAIKAPGEHAGYPPEAACMGCHLTIKKDSAAIQKVADFAAQKKRIPWVQVYELPRQVYFSHEIHYKKAKVECSVCHGPVAEREALGQEKSIGMADCMACHDRYKASNDCNLCHDAQ